MSGLISLCWDWGLVWRAHLNTILCIWAYQRMRACIFHKRSSSQAAQNLITGFHICKHRYNRTRHPSLPSHQGPSVWSLFCIFLPRLSLKVLFGDRAAKCNAKGRQADNILCCMWLFVPLNPLTLALDKTDFWWWRTKKWTSLKWILSCQSEFVSIGNNCVGSPPYLGPQTPPALSRLGSDQLTPPQSNDQAQENRFYFPIFNM